MNRKVKILLSALSVISALSLCSCGKTQEEVTTAVWDSAPAEVMQTEAVTYSSYEEPFANAYKNRLAAFQSENGKTEFTAAYVDTSGNALAVLSYVNSDGNAEFLILKFRDGIMYDFTIPTEFTKITSSNDLLIDKNSDILVLKYKPTKESVRQVIYNFSGDEYTAVRDRTYGFDETEAMDTALKDVSGDKAADLVSFSGKAVKENVNSYIEKSLGMGTE